MAEKALRTAAMGSNEEQGLRRENYYENQKSSRSARKKDQRRKLSGWTECVHSYKMSSTNSFNRLRCWHGVLSANGRRVVGSTGKPPTSLLTSGNELSLGRGAHFHLSYSTEKVGSQSKVPRSDLTCKKTPKSAAKCAGKGHFLEVMSHTCYANEETGYTTH